MVADPGQVVHAEGGARNDPETVRRKASDGEVALDAAGFIQHLRVSQRADTASDAIVGEALEKFARASTPHLDLGERCEVEDGGRLAARVVLDPDRRRPQASGPTVWTQSLVAARPVGLEPVGPLPSGLLAERCAELGE